MTSPVTTILEPNPSRVRNIFICSGVVFCASSRMMNASLSVRPRMYASGATSIVPGGHQPRDRVGVDHVVQRVVQRPQVRVDLLVERARQEAEPLAGLDRRTGQDDPADLLGLQRLHRLGHREVGLAGAGRADAEHDRVLVDRVDVPLLVERLRADRPAAVAEDVEGEHVGRGRCEPLLRSMVTLRSTASAVSGWPVRSTITSSSIRRSTRATSAASPVTVISLPRTWIVGAAEGPLDDPQELVPGAQQPHHRYRGGHHDLVLGGGRPGDVRRGLRHRTHATGRARRRAPRIPERPG